MTYSMYRFLVAWLVVVTVAVLATLGVMVLLWSTLSGQGDTLKRQGDTIAQSVSGQTGNRVANVSTWCNAINDQGATINAYVNVVAKRNPGAVPRLNLAHLPCAALEQSTAASTTHGSSKQTTTMTTSRRR